MKQTYKGALPYIHLLTPKAIWLIRQNKPSLIVKDFELFGIPKDTTYSILLARGVFKWLAARRDIIRLKDSIKDDVKKTLDDIRFIKAQLKADKTRREYHARLHYLRGYLRAKEEDRKAIRAICHSERFRAPDFDKKANEFLESLNDNGNLETEAVKE